MAIMLKLTVAKWANAFIISWAHTKQMVANASGRAKSFPPDQCVFTEARSQGQGQ